MPTDNFANLVGKALNRTGENMEKVARGTLLQATSSIVMRTPVRSGRARGNWQASIGSPANGETDNVDTQGQATISEAGDAISQSIGDEFYLVNNLPYIKRLEFEGWSGQSPEGFVRITLREIEAALEREARKAR